MTKTTNPVQKFLSSFLSPKPMIGRNYVAELTLGIDTDLPLDVYEGLDDIGPNRQRIMEFIAEQWPCGPGRVCVRHNRRQLYRSICFLFKDSKRAWVYSLPVRKGEYTEDKLARVVNIYTRQTTDKQDLKAELNRFSEAHA